MRLRINKKREVIYPPVVAAHLTNNLGDLVEPHYTNQKDIELYFSAQPNSSPHLGTLTTIASTFGLANLLAKRLLVDVKVTFEALDNAPSLKRESNGTVYFIPMCFDYEGGISKGDINLNYFKNFLDEISQISGVDYFVKKYSDLQKSKQYRDKLFNILDKEPLFSKYLSPLDSSIKARVLCPDCQYGDKSGNKTDWTMQNNLLQITSSCDAHGDFTQLFDHQNGGFIDLNTPLRSVIRKALLMDDSKENNSLKVMMDGSDWVGMSQLLLPCLGNLGYNISELPVRFFSPLIEDWSGSKFSKSAYVSGDTYSHVPKELCDYSEFKKILGSNGTNLVWEECLGWVNDSKKFFRNYTVDYFIEKWDLSN